MGDPRKIRKKYSPPDHPWGKARIDEERDITRNYALKNKKEIWKMVSILRDFKKQAKKLNSLSTKQSEKEKALLLKKLVRKGFLKETDNLDAVLVITAKDIFERRLQTLVVKKGLARTMKQARQFITHRHIKVNDSIVTSPSYLVTPEVESTIVFSDISPLTDPNHTERAIPQKTEEKKAETVEKQ